MIGISKMENVRVTGTKWYIDVEYKGNIVRFNGEMCMNGFYATVNALSWIKHKGNIDEDELPNIIKSVQKYNKKNTFKIYFVNDDGSEYK